MAKKKKAVTPAKIEVETKDETESNESPRERFLRLAPPRTESALKRIKLLSNLAGSSYEYEPGEAKQIIEALFDAVHDLKRKFEKKSAKRGGGFQFKSKSNPKQHAEAAE